MFRRFREAVMQRSGARQILIDYWMGHSNASMGDRYGKQLVEDVEYRQRQVITSSLFAQNDTFVPPNDVSLLISTERGSYRAGEQITLKYRVTNISNAPLYVPREWEARCPAAPHVWAWFENSSGQHFVPGYAGSCSPTSNPKSVSERMSKEAVLLKPDEYLDGTFRLDTKLFGGLKPGAYRIEAALTGWAEEKFTDAERSELARMGSPFMQGEVPSSTRITLTPNEK